MALKGRLNKLEKAHGAGDNWRTKDEAAWTGEDYRAFAEDFSDRMGRGDLAEEEEQLMEEARAFLEAWEPPEEESDGEESDGEESSGELGSDGGDQP